MPGLPLRRRIGAVLGLSTALQACSPEVPPAPPPLARVEAARPADARLAQLYERSCLACHARLESGAPLSGDAAAWTQRLQKKGMPALLQSVAQGLGGMPALGLCPDCTAADVEALIRFMSQPL